jgi:hypothetical protein
VLDNPRFILIDEGDFLEKEGRKMSDMFLRGILPSEILTL